LVGGRVVEVVVVGVERLVLVLWVSVGAGARAAAGVVVVVVLLILVGRTVVVVVVVGPDSLWVGTGMLLCWWWRRRFRFARSRGGRRRLRREYCSGIRHAVAWRGRAVGARRVKGPEGPTGQGTTR
jgi:hypothetical protein